MAEQNDNTETNEKGKKITLLKFKIFIQTYVPITSWLPAYKWKEYFVGDLMGGLTLGCIHVPQALAFSMLAQASPILGLYTSCFPVMIYCLFGTAFISSFGPVALNSLMVGSIVNNHANSGFTNDQIVIATTFLVGINYLLAYLFRIAVLTRLFTKTLTSGFICGCAAQVILSTLKVVLGIQIEDAKGYFTTIFNTYNTFSNISATNMITLGISLCIFAVFLFNTFVIKPLMEKCTKFILPIEIIVMITVTTVSFLLQLNSLGVEIVGFTPSGFPNFILPEFQAVPMLYVDSVVLFFVSFTASITLSFMLNPGLRPDQEILALGIANTICSTLQCMTLSNSMMRTVVARSCGIKTLLSSIIAASLILMVILFMGPLFHPLPLCVLGCIVIYGLGSLLIQLLREVPKTIQSSWENTLIWSVTISVTLLISIVIGLCVGMALSVRQFLANLNTPEDNNVESSQIRSSSQPTNVRRR